jgi:hypothetical protein
MMKHQQTPTSTSSITSAGEVAGDKPRSKHRDCGETLQEHAGENRTVMRLKRGALKKKTADLIEATNLSQISG